MLEGLCLGGAGIQLLPQGCDLGGPRATLGVEGLVALLEARQLLAGQPELGAGLLQRGLQGGHPLVALGQGLLLVVQHALQTIPRVGQVVDFEIPLPDLLPEIRRLLLELLQVGGELLGLHGEEIGPLTLLLGLAAELLELPPQGGDAVTADLQFLTQLLLRGVGGPQALKVLLKLLDLPVSRPDLPPQRLYGPQHLLVLLLQGPELGRDAVPLPGDGLRRLEGLFGGIGAGQLVPQASLDPGQLGLVLSQLRGSAGGLLTQPVAFLGDLGQQTAALGSFRGPRSQPVVVGADIAQLFGELLYPLAGGAQLLFGARGALHPLDEARLDVGEALISCLELALQALRDALEAAQLALGAFGSLGEPLDSLQILRALLLEGFGPGGEGLEGLGFLRRQPGELVARLPEVLVHRGQLFADELEISVIVLSASGRGFGLSPEPIHVLAELFDARAGRLQLGRPRGLGYPQLLHPAALGGQIRLQALDPLSGAVGRAALLLQLRAELLELLPTVLGGGRAALRLLLRLLGRLPGSFQGDAQLGELLTGRLRGLPLSLQIPAETVGDVFEAGDLPRELLTELAIARGLGLMPLELLLEGLCVLAGCGERLLFLVGALPPGPGLRQLVPKRLQAGLVLPGFSLETGDGLLGATRLHLALLQGLPGLLGRFAEPLQLLGSVLGAFPGHPPLGGQLLSGLVGAGLGVLGRLAGLLQGLLGSGQPGLEGFLLLAGAGELLAMLLEVLLVSLPGLLAAGPLGLEIPLEPRDEVLSAP